MGFRVSRTMNEQQVASWFDDPDEPSLFAEPDRSIARMEQGRDAGWIKRAERAVLALAMPGNEFTTDDVWRIMDGEVPGEPRAMGAVIRKLVRRGVIEGTGKYVKSNRIECHHRPVPVWRGATTKGSDK